MRSLFLLHSQVLGPLERDIAFLCERLYEVKMLVQEKEEELQITSAEYRETAKHRSDLEKTKALLELKRKELDLVVAEHRALMSKHNPFSEPTDEFKAELKGDHGGSGDLYMRFCPNHILTLLLLAALMMKGKELQQQVDDLEANEKAKRRDSSAHVSVEMAKAMDGLSELQMKQAALEESKEKKTQALERCQQLDIKCRAIVLTTPILSPDEVRSMTASSNRFSMFTMFILGSFIFGSVSFLIIISFFGCQDAPFGLSNSRGADTRAELYRRSRRVVLPLPLPRRRIQKWRANGFSFPSKSWWSVPAHQEGRCAWD